MSTTTVGTPDFLNVAVPMIKAKRDDSPVPVGSIVSINSRGAQADLDCWIVCDGREFDPSEYPELASLLTTKRATERQRTLRDRLLRRLGKPVMVYGTNRVPDLMGRLL